MPGWRTLIGGFATVLALAIASTLLIHAWQIEGRWRDIAFRMLAAHAPVPAHDGVVVVGLDEEDLRQMAVPLALMHRPLGAFLEAAALGAATAVGLDIALPEVSFDALVPGLDAALARGIVVARHATSLVVGLGVNQGGRVQPLHAPFAALLGPQRLAWLVVLPDGDGVVRRFDERLAQDGGRLPTLAGQLARVSGIEVVDGWIHYAHGAPWQPVALRQVLAWHAAGDEVALRRTFEGRHVLLGSLLAFDDQHRTPRSLVGSSDFAGTSHGVLLHAQQLRNLLEGRIVRPTPGWLAWASFSGMVSPAVLDEIVSGRLDTQSAGTRRDVCVLFSDIRGFTTLSEAMGPEEVTALLNRYFSRMAAAVHQHGGTLDKFIGDGIMAVFGAPQPAANACDDAVAAARAMLVALDAFNAEPRIQGGPELRVGIGLHHGPAVVGYAGSPQRFEYSAIGDTVNTASRIESLTNVLGFPVFLSTEVAARLALDALRDALVLLVPHPVRGRSAVVIHGLRVDAQHPFEGDTP